MSFATVLILHGQMYALIYTRWTYYNEIVYYKKTQLIINNNEY